MLTMNIPNLPSAAASHEDIAAHAYAFWEEAGCPQGLDNEFWLQAEKDLAVKTRDDKAVWEVLSTSFKR